jgi:hypothetical protein
MAVLTINRGLVTSPNELTTPDGAADILDNCNIDFDNIVQSRRGFAEFGNQTDDSSVVKQLMTYKGRIIRHFANKLSFDSTGNGTFLNFSGSYSELVNKLRIKYFELNSNLYFTTIDGIKKISATSADDFTTSAGFISNAGAVKALSVDGNIIPAASGFLPAQSKVAYKVLWAKKDANSNIVRGVPSSRLVITNSTKDINSGEQFEVIVTEAGAGIHKTFDATTAVSGPIITIPSHGFTNGTKVRLFGNIAPELNSSTDYYIISAATDTFELSLSSGGSAIVLTDVAGTSNIYSGLNSEHFFTFDTPTNKFACWFNISGEDSAPTDTVLVGRDLREVQIYKIAIKNKENYMAKIAETLFSISDISVAASATSVVVTNVDGGNVLNASAGNIATTLLTVSTVLDGQTAVGTPANVSLNFTVPTEIITNSDRQYFYEIYRTAPITVPTGLTLNDIDPGEEFQKIAELPIAEINQPIPSSISYEDVAPETFRVGGLFLYTNPVTGEGSLQSNEPPPVAHDVAIFKGSAFYANTKERHRIQFNLLSVSQLISETSKLYVGNSQVLREYTFVGQNEIVRFEAKKRSETVSGSYFDISSAQNKIKYRLWFDKKEISHVITAASINSTTDEITVTNHGFTTNEKIEISGGLPPGGLLSGTSYYVIKISDNVFKLSFVVNGSPVDLSSSAGTCEITRRSEAPEETSYFLLRVPLELYDDTVQGSVNAFVDAFSDISDFLVEDVGVGYIKVTYQDNGQADDVVQSVQPTGWTFPPIYDQQGFGEDASQNEVLLSGLASQDLSVEDTARSLERVINKDTLSPVTAFYLSGLNDLPGILLLEAKSLTDDAIFLGFSHATDKPVFEPSLPVAKVVTDLESPGVFTTSSSHGFTVGQQVYTYIKPTGSPILLSGKEVVATTPAPTTLSISGFSTNDSYISFDKALIFSADVVSDNSINPNRVYFSKIGQPEAVPLVNYIDIGPKDKAIQRILALRDSLIVLKEDGVYVITGPSAPNFSFRLSDSSALTYAPDTATNLNNLIYVLTSQGVVTVSETGVGVISRNIEDKIQEIANAKFDYKLTSWGMSSESDRCYLLWLPVKTTDAYATQAFRYNTFTRNWTRWTKPANCGVVNPADDKIYLGDSSGRPYVLKERKNFERQDYADREIVRVIGANAINGTTYTISSVAELEPGDSLVQQQYLDINKFNRFLKKLDRDSLLSNDYYSSLVTSTGDSLASKLSSVAAKLTLDGLTIPPLSGTENFEDIRDDFNSIVDALNSPGSIASFKNYKKALDLLVYETLVTDVIARDNKISVKFSTKFVQGEVSFFKSIKCLVRYAPQHFGKPESTKQVSEGTFIFDQNNFWGGSVGYSSDRSYDFSTITFSGRGPGYWDGYSWANVTFGGEGNEVPVRTLIPKDKSRCRYLHVQFIHSNAREEWKLIGVSLEPREVSTRGYR